MEKQVSKPKYLPFASGQWRLSLGMKPLNIQEWIEIDEHFCAELALKDKLLKERYSEVFASLQGSEPSQLEALELLLDHLLEYFPQHYQRLGRKIENLTTGQVWDTADFEAAPLDLAGRLVQEDLAILQPSPNGYVLAAASICFPLRWRLQQKIGHPLVKIHQPVPEYDRIARPVDALFNRLQPNNPVWRLNWSIVDSPELFLAPEQGQDLELAIAPENAGEKLWIRVERQSLRRLEHSGNILFAIHTYVHALSVLEDKPAVAANLAAVVKQIPPDMQSYKNLLPIREVLLDYLERVGGAGRNCSKYGIEG
jgi:hypothetical protein